MENESVRTHLAAAENRRSQLRVRALWDSAASRIEERGGKITGGPTPGGGSAWGMILALFPRERLEG